MYQLCKKENRGSSRKRDRRNRTTPASGIYLDITIILTMIMVMSPAGQYTLQFAPETIGHLRAIERKYHRLIRQTVNEQLCFTPEEETRNRKPMRPPAPFGATWELRFGPDNRFRVFYEVVSAESVVWILAIGVKRKNRLFIGKEEFGL